MANTLTGYGQTILGKDIDGIQAELNKIVGVRPNLNVIKKLGAQLNNVPKGTTTVNLPYPSFPTGSVSLTSGVVVFDQTANNITLALSNDNGYFVGFNMTEVQQYDLPTLTTDYVATSVYGVDRTLLSASLEQIVKAGNFNTASNWKGAAAACSQSALIELISEAETTYNLDPANIVVGLKSSYYWALVNSIAGNGNQAGADALRSGSPNNPFGVPVMNIPTMPSIGNSVGFIAQRGATILATAIPSVQHSTGESGIIVSPNTEVPMLFEYYFDDYRRKWLIGASCVWASSKGVANSALVIVSS